MKIVAPAGDINRFYAAVDGGAHEIYMGLKGFGARKNAKNFTMAEYKAALFYAHERGSKIFLTLNTVMMDNEFEPLFENLNTLYKCGLDAIIVQDFGMFKYLKENFPEIELHGSTQMTVGNHIEAEYLRELGFKRVVLSRELTFEEIAEIRKKTTIELEVFVSGALCVAYSGKCFMSSFIGARSGNRGMCAQPCRKEYAKETGEKGYFLSPKDQLMEQEEIEMLKSIGIESIKLEGRMKDENYVYELVSYYKKLIDGENREPRIHGIFNRSYGKGYFYGNTNIINKNFSYNLGKEIGIVSGKEVLLSEGVIFGDGLTYVSKNYEKLGGGNLSKIIVKREDNKRFRSSDEDKVREGKKGDKIIINDLPPGTRYIYKTYSKELDDSLIKERHSSEKKIDIQGYFRCKLNEKPELTFTYTNLYGKTVTATVQGESLSEKASKKGATPEDVYEKIAQLGETTLNLNKENFRIDLEEELFIPLSIIKQLKRDCADEIIDKITESYEREGSLNLKKIERNEDVERVPETIAIVKTDEQKEVLESLGVKKIYFSRKSIVNEKDILTTKTDKNYLSYNVYHLKTEEKREHLLHWSFNVTNSYSLNLLESIENLHGVMLSPELSFEKIKKLNKTRLKKGLLIYSKPKVMHIETEISKDSTRLINDMNDKFTLNITESGNTEVYLDAPLNVTDRMEEISTLGIDYVVLEFNFETPEEIAAIYKGIKNRRNRPEDYGDNPQKNDSQGNNTLGYNYWKGVY